MIIRAFIVRTPRLLWCILMVGAVAAPAVADDLLDRALEQEAGAATQPTTQVAGLPPLDLSDEDRRQLDDLMGDMLAEQFLGQKQADDPMGKAVRFADAARERLESKFDPGMLTQAIQRELLKTLDAEIEAAKKQQSSSSSSSDNQQQEQGEKQERGDSAQQPAPKPGPARGQQQQSGDPSSNTSAADGSSPGSNQGLNSFDDIREGRRNWGNLPLRDRDEIVSSQNDEVLEKHRELIERYRRMLSGE